MSQQRLRRRPHRSIFPRVEIRYGAGLLPSAAIKDWREGAPGRGRSAAARAGAHNDCPENHNTKRVDARNGERTDSRAQLASKRRTSIRGVPRCKCALCPADVSSVCDLSVRSSAGASFPRSGKALVRRSRAADPSPHTCERHRHQSRASRVRLSPEVCRHK